MYRLINWFFLFSFIGYLLECVVLTYENIHLVFNRGFGHGPFCVIYGVGAAGALILLEPVSHSPVRLYLFSMIMATAIELFTGHVMVKLFGTFWWDYSRKPFNYKGMICLESSIAWGFLGILFFRFLNGLVFSIVDRIPEPFGGVVAGSLLFFYIGDFIYTMDHQLKKRKDTDRFKRL